MTLESHEWNSIFEEVGRQLPSPEVTFAVVRQRDVLKKLIWVDRFENMSIPLVSFDFSFVLYLPDSFGVTVKYADQNPEDVSSPRFLTILQVPKIGDTVVILQPGGQLQFPICIGKLHSTDYWTGDT